MSINVNPDIDDAFYRYKMPKLLAKVEGKGNGIKTVIVNMLDIGKALYRKPGYPTKYFGCELGAQVSVDTKNDRYIVNGAHEACKLQELLYTFIKKFVLCQKCSNPETVLSVRKKQGIVTAKCKACGHIDCLDATHRVTQYIIKNPPTSEASGGTGRETQRISPNRTDNGDANDGNDESGCTHENGIENGNRPSNDNGSDDGDDQDWLIDASEEGQLQRISELSEAAKALALDDARIELTPAEKADQLYNFVKACRDSNTVFNKKMNIKKEADQLGLGEPAIMIIMEVLLNRKENILEDIKANRDVFLLFTRVADPSIAKRTQKYTLGAMEKTIQQFDLAKKSCHILKELYDCDIVEEEVILEWHLKASKRFVDISLSREIRELCQPMVAWLKAAEEESEEDSEEEDEETHRNGHYLVESYEKSTRMTQRANGVPSKSTDQNDDDDLDIDAI